MGRFCREIKGSSNRQARLAYVGYCAIIIMSMLDLATSGRSTVYFEAGKLETHGTRLTDFTPEDMRMQKSSDQAIDMQNHQLLKNNSSSSSIYFKSKSEKTRQLNGVGSAPPECSYKCKSCNPCTAVRVPIKLPRVIKLAEYYPEAWRCRCGGKLYVP